MAMNHREPCINSIVCIWDRANVSLVVENQSVVSTIYSSQISRDKYIGFCMIMCVGICYCMEIGFYKEKTLQYSYYKTAPENRTTVTEIWTFSWDDSAFQSFYNIEIMEGVQIFS